MVEVMLMSLHQYYWSEYIGIINLRSLAQLLDSLQKSKSKMFREVLSLNLNTSLAMKMSSQELGTIDPSAFWWLFPWRNSLASLAAFVFWLLSLAIKFLFPVVESQELDQHPAASSAVDHCEICHWYLLFISISFIPFPLSSSAPLHYFLLPFSASSHLSTRRLVF